MFVLQNRCLILQYRAPKLRASWRCRINLLMCCACMPAKPGAWAACLGPLLCRLLCCTLLVVMVCWAVMLLDMLAHAFSAHAKL